MPSLLYVRSSPTIHVMWTSVVGFAAVVWFWISPPSKMRLELGNNNCHAARISGRVVSSLYVAHAYSDVSIAAHTAITIERDPSNNW
jgi:hypothetical protein